MCVCVSLTFFLFSNGWLFCIFFALLINDRHFFQSLFDMNKLINAEKFLLIENTYVKMVQYGIFMLVCQERKFHI